MSVSTTLTTYLYRVLIITTILVVSAVVVYRYVDTALAEVRTVVAAEIQATVTKAEALVGTASLAATEPAYESLLSTCSRETQARFDTALNALGSGLSPQDLEFLAVYFDRCAGQFAREQILVGAALADTVVQLERWRYVFTLLPGGDEDLVSVSTWQALVQEEIMMGQLQMELVEAQRDLVLARLAGEAVTSPGITTTLEQVETTRERATAVRETRRAHYEELGL